MDIKVHSSQLEQEGLSSFADSVWYLSLEYTEESVIGSVNDLLFYEDMIFVIDKDVAESVVCFGHDGSYRFRISSKGRGPGEYISIEDVAIDRENRLILIYDRSSTAILEYDFDGVHIATYKLDMVFESFYHLSGNTIVAYAGYEINPELGERANSSIFTVNYRRPKENKTYLTFDENLSLSEKTPRLFNNFSPEHDNLFIYDYYRRSLYKFAFGGLSLFATFDFGDLNIPQSAWVTKNIMEISKMISDGEIIGGVSNYQVIGKWLFGFYVLKRNYALLVYNMKEDRVYSNLNNLMNDLSLGSSGKYGFPVLIHPKIHSDGDNLIVIIEPLHLHHIISQVEDLNKVHGNVQHIPEQLKGIPANGNPVLQFIRLKK
jgi:hypothetical protein